MLKGILRRTAMSLIHWNKSVLTLHLKEVLEDHQAGDPRALLGLGAILVGTVVVPAASKLGKPALKSIIKMGLSLSAQGKPRFPPYPSPKSVKKKQPLSLNK